MNCPICDGLGVFDDGTACGECSGSGETNDG